MISAAPPPSHHAAGDGARQCVRLGRDLDDVAVGRFAQAGRQRRRRGSAEDEGEAVAGRGKTDAALVPAAAGAHELADRQGIEELVGDEDERAVGHVREPLPPHRRRRQPQPGKRARLDLPQQRARLDEDETQGVCQRRQRLINGT